MKKKYIVPTLQIEKFHVEDIITESAEITDVLRPYGIMDEEEWIEFDNGNTLQSIDYRKFLK